MKMTSNSRVRRSEREWKSILDKYRRSGVSVRAFCRREGVVLTSFKRWQKRLEAGNGKPEFVELMPPSETSRDSWELDISFPNGVRLQFRG
ncbi:MAG: hypothetical protein JSV80_04920 [Acidobacteriota bacterium]|nr:MAG: hypothetical protein JSV80_04920 [Acidobacteriota bacterium]